MKKKEAILNMSDKAFDSAWDKACSKVERSAYEAGVAEGRRLERRLTKKELKRLIKLHSFYESGGAQRVNATPLQDWLASRSKARKGKKP